MQQSKGNISPEKECGYTWERSPEWSCEFDKPPLVKTPFSAYTETKNVEPTIIEYTIWKLGQPFSSKK